MRLSFVLFFLAAVLAMVLASPVDPNDLEGKEEFLIQTSSSNWVLFLIQMIQNTSTRKVKARTSATCPGAREDARLVHYRDLALFSALSEDVSAPKLQFKFEVQLLRLWTIRIEVKCSVSNNPASFAEWFEDFQTKNTKLCNSEVQNLFLQTVIKQAKTINSPSSATTANLASFRLVDVIYENRHLRREPTLCQPFPTPFDDIFKISFPYKTSSVTSNFFYVSFHLSLHGHGEAS